MNRRAATLCCVLGAGCTPSAEAPAPAPDTPLSVRYAPFYATYLLALQGTQVQELPTGPAASQYSARVYVGVQLTQASSEFHIAFTVDSIESASGVGAGVDEARSLVGMTFTGRVVPDSGIRDLRGGGAGLAFTRTLRHSLVTLFPIIPSTGAEPGAAWSLTMEQADTSAGFAVTTRSETSFTASDWVAAENGGGLFIDGRSAYVIRGGGQQLGQTVDLEGSGTRAIRIQLYADGIPLSSTATDSSRTIAAITAMGLSIPIAQSRTDTLRIVTP